MKLSVWAKKQGIKYHAAWHMFNNGLLPTAYKLPTGTIIIPDELKHLRRNRKSSHWTYTDIKRKLESKCEQQGVLVVYVSPTYTSQRCSHCGWVQKSNRKGKNFNCVSCSFAADADINASKNIALRLSPLSDSQRLQQNNRTGFFYRAVGDERIVRHTKKTKRNRS